MNIALIGYGKMGKEIESLAPSKNLLVVKKFDRQNSLAIEKLQSIDVAIDFSSPSCVKKNIELCAGAGIAMVVGTTGWQSELDDVKRIVMKSGIGFIYASNFSIGVNLFFKIVQNATKMVDAFDHYDVSLHEIHHRQKLDSPSGTAITLGEKIIEKWSRKKRISEPRENPIPKDVLQITSARVGSVPGTHAVTFDSAEDSIELIHTARNRRGFALGALLAAEWIRDKKGVFTMEDVLNFRL